MFPFLTFVWLIALALFGYWFYKKKPFSRAKENRFPRMTSRGKKECEDKGEE